MSIVRHNGQIKIGNTVLDAQIEIDQQMEHLSGDTLDAFKFMMDDLFRQKVSYPVCLQFDASPPTGPVVEGSLVQPIEDTYRLLDRDTNA